MSENQGLTTDTAPPSAAVNVGVQPGAPAPEPAGAVSAPAPAGDVLDQQLGADDQMFTRSYVESIRREAQGYRGRAQEYDEVFGVYEPQDRDVWFNLARTWADNPQHAAQIMQQIANGVLGEQTVPTPDQQQRFEAPNDDLDDGEWTPEKIEQLIDQRFQSRDQQAAEQTAINNVMSEVREAGFDPNSAEGFMVLWNANNQTNGDVKAAAEMVRQYRQGIVDQYVQGRSTGRVAMPGTNQGVTAQPAGEPITNLEDARKAADAYLRERRGA